MTNQKPAAKVREDPPISRIVAADVPAPVSARSRRSRTPRTPPARSQEFEHLDDEQLLAHLGRVNDELRARGFTRTGNGVVADLAEKLAGRYFGVEPEPNSKKHYDLETKEGSLVQVKGRKPPYLGAPVQSWSAMHGLTEHGFDEVVAVVFNPDFTVREAYRLPWEAAERYKQRDTQGEYELSCTVAFRADPQVVAFDINQPLAPVDGASR